MGLQPVAGPRDWQRTTATRLALASVLDDREHEHDPTSGSRTLRTPGNTTSEPPQIDGAGSARPSLAQPPAVTHGGTVNRSQRMREEREPSRPTAASAQPDDHSALFRRRKPVKASFVAKGNFPSPCPVCGLGVDAGQRARYNLDNAVVHHAHARAETRVEVCPTCWLAKPCECDT